jgi:hypothetical protein
MKGLLLGFLRALKLPVKLLKGEKSFSKAKGTKKRKKFGLMFETPLQKILVGRGAIKK